MFHLQRLNAPARAPAALVQIDAGALQPAADRYLAGTAVLADALNEDGNPNSRGNPARPGELVTLFVTDIGGLRPELSERDKGGPIPARPYNEVVIETAAGARRSQYDSGPHHGRASDPLPGPASLSGHGTWF
jgi:uncharacterized protein (TIGR03437 family)